MPKKSTKKPIKIDQSGKLGRPPKFISPEQMQKQIDEYFIQCEEGKLYRWKDKKGNYCEEILPRIPSVIDLALFLGFESVVSLHNYTHRNDGHENFAKIITRAKNKIAAEKLNMGLQGLIDPHITRLDLAANHGMSEKRELTLSVEDNRTVDPAMLPIINRARDAILAEMIEQERKQLQAPDIIDVESDETLSDTD